MPILELMFLPSFSDLQVGVQSIANNVTDAVRHNTTGFVGTALSWFGAIFASTSDLEVHLKLGTYCFAILASVVAIVCSIRKDRRETREAHERHGR